jgi:hypothetical protein
MSKCPDTRWQVDRARGSGSAVDNDDREESRDQSE